LRRNHFRLMTREDAEVICEFHPLLADFSVSRAGSQRTAPPSGPCRRTSVCGRRHQTGNRTFRSGWKRRSAR
jgi:hypothetical protein